MSDTWNEGYFTEVGYTYGYYRDQAPEFMRFCLLLRGYDALASKDPWHCELGFGQGVSFNVHAAATPGHFAGNDFTPSHAAFAAKMAAASGVDALLTDDSFEEFLARKDLPQFDSISLHGIWAWITRENRHYITEFARRHLKPGGMFYVSYNCFPGWSPAAPLRHLFAQFNRHAASPESPEKRVGQALEFTQKLLAAKPLYASNVTSLDKRLEKIMEQNRTYLSHEYFNREWNCMYFTDVVDELSAAKLDYACTAVPLDTIDLVNLGKDAQTFLATIENPILREQARDYFVNQQFRKDIYLRGASRLPVAEQRKRLLATRFVLTQWPEDIPKKVTGCIGEANLLPELYDPVIAALASRDYAPKTLRELLDVIPSENKFGSALQVVTMLVALGAVSPCQTESQMQQVKQRCGALNRFLYEESRYNSNVLVVASPLIGTGFPLDRFSKLFILAELNKRSDAVAFAWEILQANNEVLLKDGERLLEKEANIEELKGRHERFVQRTRPLLKVQGIV